MENIFEGAKFGDKFKTSDGRMAIYFKEPGNESSNNSHRLIIQGEYNVFLFNDNGRLKYEENYFSDLRIISKYNEECYRKAMEETK